LHVFMMVVRAGEHDMISDDESIVQSVVLISVEGIVNLGTGEVVPC